MPLRRSSACALLLLSLAGTACQGGAAPAVAQDAAKRDVLFDIPAQPLDAALDAYFRATGVQLLYTSAVVAQHRSAPLHGRYPVRTALERLLAGTGLIARYGAHDAVFIAPAETAAMTSALPPIPLGRVTVQAQLPAPELSLLDRLAYYAAVKQRLEALVRSDARLGRVRFSAVVALHVGRDGQISGLQLDRPSGNRRIDDVLIDALGAATVATPPPGLPQPLTITLTGRWRE